jgi:serine/threonine protein kinase
MKVINKTFIIKNKKQQLIINERAVMTGINHPLHAKLHWAFESKSALIFVMDFYAGGELFGLIKVFRRMTENMARFYIIEILLALEKLHDAGIAYRDLKPENILLDLEGHVHLADFGLVKPGLKKDDQRAFSFCGSPEYMPPEVIARKGHTVTADFYSLGALLYELITGLPPFYSRDPEKIYNATLKQPLVHFANFSPNLRSLFEGLLCKEHGLRLGARYGVREVLAHPWFGVVHPQ